MVNGRESPGPDSVLGGAQLALWKLGQRQLLPWAQCHTVRAASPNLSVG